MILVEQNELPNLPQELSNLPQPIVTDRDILSKIFNLTPDMVWISQGYLESVGRYKIARWVDSIALLIPSIYVVIFDMNNDIPKIVHDNICIIRSRIEDLKLEHIKTIVEGRPITVQSRKDSTDFLLSDEFAGNINSLYNTSMDGLMNYIEDNASKIVELVNHVNDASRENLILNKQVDEYKEKIALLTSATKEMKIESLQSEVKRLKEDRDKLYNVMVNNLNSIENLRNKEEPEPIQVKSELINIIYFKEIDDINFFPIFDAIGNRFIELGRYTKLLVLEKDNNSIKIYPDYMQTFPGIEYNEVIQAERLVNYGNGINLIEMITNPTLGIETLFVLDRRGGYKLPFLQNKNILPMYLVRDIDLVALDIDERVCVSPNSGPYKNIKDLMNLNSTALDIWIKTTELFKYIEKFIIQSQVRRGN